MTDNLNSMPADIRKKAYIVATDVLHTLAGTDADIIQAASLIDGAIADALMAERDRCAEVAKEYGRKHGQKVEWDREGSLIEACADRIAEIILDPKGGA